MESQNDGIMGGHGKFSIAPLFQSGAIIKTFPSTLTCYKDSKPYSNVSQYQLEAPVTQDT